MSAPYSYRVEDGIVFLKYDSDWSVEKVFDVSLRSMADPQVDPAFPRIVLVECTIREIQIGDFVKVRDFYASNAKKFGGPKKVAYVSKDPEVSLIIKLFSQLNNLSGEPGPTERRFFVSEAEARAWVKA